MNEKAETSILVVDDVKDCGITIKFMLMDEGYKCAWTNSINNAVQLLEKKNFDLALLDLRLDEVNENDISGLQLAEIIRDRWNFMKVVVITGYGPVNLLRRALKEDDKGEKLIDDIIEKTSLSNLPEVVKQILSV